MDRIPDRTKPKDYHFYAYDFKGSKPFEPGTAQPSRTNLQFYSLKKDLEGLRGYRDDVPNMTLSSLGHSLLDPSQVGGIVPCIDALQFGGKAATNRWWSSPAASTPENGSRPSSPI